MLTSEYGYYGLICANEFGQIVRKFSVRFVPLFEIINIPCCFINNLQHGQYI